MKSTPSYLNDSLKENGTEIYELHLLWSVSLYIEWWIKYLTRLGLYFLHYKVENGGDITVWSLLNIWIIYCFHNLWIVCWT